MIAATDPVLSALARLNVLADADLDLLQREGRLYRGVELPAGITRWPQGECLDASDALERARVGKFVIGFALRPDDDLPLGHAWVSPDGRTAVDGVWTLPERCLYFGVPGHRRERRVLRMWEALSTLYGWNAPEPAGVWDDLPVP